MGSRIFATSIGMLLLVQAVPVFGYFLDTAGTRYNDAYVALEARGIVQGYNDGTARPRAPINRVEALKLALEAQPRFRERISWYKAHLPRLPLFLDIDQTAWYAPYIETAFEAGLITGYPDRTFRPGNPLETEEATALLMRASGSRTVAAGEVWFQKDIEQAAAKNLIAAEESMYLGEPITRGQFVDMVYRLDYTMQNRVAAFPSKPGESPRGLLARRLVPIAVAARPTTSIPSGTTSGRVSQFTISIPVLNIDNLLVTHPADAVTSKGLLSVLKDGVGHLFAFPGAGAKIMVYGHSSGYPWDVSEYTKIFRRVNELQPGDRVYITYNGKQYMYEVTYQQTISPNDTSPFSGQGEELILFTCWPPDSTKTRLLVHAKPASDIALR